MKTFTYYDHRHGNIYNVEAKDRRQAKKILVKNLAGKWFELQQDILETVFEAEKVINFK